MPAVATLPDAQHVLLVAVRSTDDLRSSVTATLAAGRPRLQCQRVLAVLAAQIVGAFERMPAVDRPGFTLTPTSDPTAAALVGSALPRTLRWAPGQRRTFRYAEPRTLGLPAYPPVLAGTVAGWSVHVAGDELVVAGAGPVVVSGVDPAGTVRLRRLGGSPSPVVHVDDDGEAPDEDAEVSAQASSDFEAEMAAIRAQIALRRQDGDGR